MYRRRNVDMKYEYCYVIHNNTSMVSIYFYVHHTHFKYL